MYVYVHTGTSFSMEQITLLSHICQSYNMHVLAYLKRLCAIRVDQRRKMLTRSASLTTASRGTPRVTTWTVRPRRTCRPATPTAVSRAVAPSAAATKATSESPVMALSHDDVIVFPSCYFNVHRRCFSAL